MFKLFALLFLLIASPVLAQSPPQTAMGDSTCPSGKRCQYTYLNVQDAFMPTGGVCGDSATPCTTDGECSPEVCEAKGCQVENLEDSTGVLQRVKCPYLAGTTSVGARCVWFKADLKNNYEDLNHDLQMFMEVDILSGRACINNYVKVVKKDLSDWDSAVETQFGPTAVTFTANDSRQVDFDDFPIIYDLINTHCETAACKDSDLYIGFCRIMDKTGSLCSTGAPGQSIGSLYIYPGTIQHPFTP